MIRNYMLVLIILQFFFNSVDAAETKIDHWKLGVVSITNQVIRSPYNNIGIFYGSGFIVNKSLGIIATNKHVVNSSNINDTIVTFYNGREFKAKLIYSDPLSDFSFLQVSTEDIPTNAIEFVLSKELPKINDQVTIIGNNEGQGFSVQTGIVTSLYEVSNYFPDQTMRISLNIRGGSSGSPIIDQKGKVVALNYATDNTYAYALTAGYLNDAYQNIKNKLDPIRQDTGAIFSYYSLDKAVRDFNFPKTEIPLYLSKFPNSQSKILITSSIIQNTPAESIMQPSDIIWKINDKLIGPNLYELQTILNNSTDFVKLSVYRKGELIDLNVNLYKPKDNQVRRMISLDNAILFEVDDYVRFITGAPIGAVFVVNVERTSGLSNIDTMYINNILAYYLQITQINNTPINSLDDVIAIIPKLKDKPDYVVYYRNFAGQGGYDKTMYFNRAVQFQDVKYSLYDEPILYTFDTLKKTWLMKKL